MTTGGAAAGTPAALRLLLTDAIDYAGLFPPAQLGMADAAAAYAAYLASDDAWALGRFVVPAARLDELVRCVEESGARVAVSRVAPSPVWRVSALIGSDAAADAGRVAAFNRVHADASSRFVAAADALELRASTTGEIASLARVTADLDVLERYVEVPITGDVRPLLRAMREHGARAKVRTGGVVASAFPNADDLARFIAGCVAERVPFKATAGLHHPLRGTYRLTYASDSAQGLMYGFLNLFVATALLQQGATEADAREAIQEPDREAFAFDENALIWRGHRLEADVLATTRSMAMTSFGSCSFREPLDDLSALGLH